MELKTKLKKLLVEKNEISLLKLESNADIKLVLTNDQSSEVNDFFIKLLRLLLEEEFNLELVKDENSSKLVEEVSEKYIERLNKELNNI